MAPNSSTARKSGTSTGRSARNASAKKSNSLAMDEIDPIMQHSQSSTDDGMMATIAQRMKVSLDKKKKEKEAKFLQAAQAEFTKILSEKAHELEEGAAEMDKAYVEFQVAYASNEDDIRKLWDAILNEQLKLQKFTEERQKMTLEREKRREKEHIHALAHCRKSCEESQRLIDALGLNYEHA